MRPLPIIHVGPDWQVSCSLVRVSRCIGLCSDVLESHLAAGIPKCEGCKASAIIGHHALDANAKTLIPDNRSLEMCHGAVCVLFGMDLSER